MKNLLIPKYWDWSTWILFICFNMWIIQMMRTPGDWTNASPPMPHEYSKIFLILIIIHLASLLFSIFFYRFLLSRVKKNKTIKTISIFITSFLIYFGISIAMFSVTNSDEYEAQNIIVYKCLKTQQFSNCLKAIYFYKKAFDSLNTSWKTKILETVTPKGYEQIVEQCKVSFNKKNCTFLLKYSIKESQNLFPESELNQFKLKTGN